MISWPCCANIRTPHPTSSPASPFSADSGAQVAGFSALLLILKRAQNRPEIISLGGLQFICDALQGHRKDERVQKAVIKTFYRLLFCSLTYQHIGIGIR